MTPMLLPPLLVALSLGGRDLLAPGPSRGGARPFMPAPLRPRGLDPAPHLDDLRELAPAPEPEADELVGDESED